MNTELRLVHNISSSNKHGKSAKDNRFTDLVKLLNMAETASGSNVQSKQNTCYRNLTWQNKAWQYSTKCIWQKSLTYHKPKRTRRYDGNHVNIASFVNRFQTWQKTEHGINSIMKASLWARFTHHKAMHDKTSIPTERWHVYEANYDKRKFIACMYQLQQPCQNWISC